MKTKAMALALLGLLGLAACSAPHSDLNMAAISEDSNNIIGGEEVSAFDGMKPYIVGLVAIKYDKRRQPIGMATCTASILSSQYLVTAAHCVQDNNPGDMRVVFGNDISTSRTVKKVLGYEVPQNWKDFQKDMVKLDEELRRRFDGREELTKDEMAEVAAEVEKFFRGDIAIVKFAGGTSLPYGYKQAELLQQPEKLVAGQKVTLAGYGISDGVNGTGSGILRKVEVSIEDGNYKPNEVLLNQTDKRGACHGDSGGPAYLKEDSKFFLWGVTSRGVKDPGDTCLAYSAYTNVLGYADFIKTAVEAMKNLKPAPAFPGFPWLGIPAPILNNDMAVL